MLKAVLPYCAKALALSCLLLLVSGFGPRLTPIVPSFRLPTFYARAFHEKDPLSAVRAKFGSVLGQTETLPGTWPNGQSIAFAPDLSGFLILAGGGFGNPSSLYLVSESGNATLITNTLDSTAISIAYSTVSKLAYITTQFGVDYIQFPSGQQTLLAGGTQGTADGQGSAAQFQGPQGIGVDPHTGNIFVTDIDRVRQITPGGLVSTLTAPGSIGPLPVGGFVNVPEGLTFNAISGRLYVADPYENVIHSVTLQGKVTSAAGQCFTQSQFPSGCDPLQRDGPANRALFDQPSGVAYDPCDGSVVIADNGNNQIRRLYKGLVTTIAGNGHAAVADGIGNAISFNSPRALAIDSRTKSLWVVDTGNQLLRLVSLSGNPPPPPTHGVIMFDPPSFESGPSSIAATADGSIWFTESQVNKIGKFTNGQLREFHLPANSSNPARITVGSDGNLWFADLFGPAFNAVPGIARMTPAGAFKQFTPPGGSFSFSPFPDLTLGPDGNIWFINGTNAIGSITPTGVIHLYPSSQSVRIGTGYDGAIWDSVRTGSTTGTIDRYATNGRLLSQLAFSTYMAGAIVRGPQSHMWISQPDAVGYIANNALFELILPACNCFNGHMVSDITMSGGVVWFPESAIGYIGRMTPSGSYIDYVVPAPRSSPIAITRAPNGVLWFADPGSHKIGEAF